MSARCEPCGMVHDGPVCVCGVPLYLKDGTPPRWQHVHHGHDDHDPRPA